jgi:hypothetical protein
MRKTIIGVSFIAFVVSVVWVINKPGYESASSVAVTLGALLAAFILKNDKQPAAQIQNVSDKSVAVQAGQDARVGNIGR